jgi:hypothetical protein
MGANGSGSQRDKKWPFTFRFESGEKLTNHTIGTITGIEKLPFEYLWCSYGEDHDTAARMVRKIAQQVEVNTVHYEGNFAQLGIGTGVLQLFV